MPKIKTDNVRKVTRKPRRGNQQVTVNNNSDSVASDESFEVANSPVHDSDQNTIEPEDGYPQDFSGEMSKLLERFSTDMNKTMQAKRRKLEQFTQV